MRQIAVAIAVGLIVSGCASMPVIGPGSYVAKMSCESRRTDAGPVSTGEAVWTAAKATLGYAFDTVLWAAAAKAVADANEDSDDTPMPSYNGDGNVFIINEEGTVNYTTNRDSFNELP